MVRNAASLLVVAVIAGVLTAGDGAARAGGDRRPIREVVGGRIAPEGKFPWMVRLSMGCGGALTAPRVVLTAGHCVDGSGANDRITVTAGVADLKAPEAITARSVQIIRAPGFRDETRGDDWAVIRLDRTLDLPTLPLARQQGDRGTFTVMGWGQTGEDSLRQERWLHYASVPTVPDKVCAAEY